MPHDVVLVDDTGNPVSPFPVAVTGFSSPLPVTETHSNRSLILKPVTVSALGNTAIWTPAAGKTVVLLGILITPVAASAAAAAVEDILIKDSATTIIKTGFYITTVPVVMPPIAINLPNDGYVSAAVNNVIYCNLSVAVSGGLIEVTAWGYEI